MILDLTHLSSEYTKRLNGIAGEIKAEYTLFVDECCRKYSDELFWVTPFSSRNTYNDATYMQICRVLLAEEAVSLGDADEVITGTRGEYLTLKKHFSGRAKVSYSAKCGISLRMIGILKRWRHFFNFLARQIAYRKYASREEFSYPEHASVVIGPAISTDFDGYHFNDRYTTGITQYHDALFLPYIVNPRKIPNRELFDRIRNCSNYRFIYDRRLLRISDTLQIIRYWRYVGRIMNDGFRYRDIDVSPVVRQNLIEGMDNSPAFDAIIMRRMLQRLSNMNVKIDHFIQWYEGRSFDVATSSAIREYFPDSTCVGYEGYPLTEIILGGCISAEQHRTGHAPDVMAVCSRWFEKDAHQFCSDVPLIYVPILRNDYVLVSKSAKGNPLSILVLLSYLPEASRQLLEGVWSFIRGNEKDYRIIVKNHPTNEGFSLADYGFNEKMEAEFVKGKLTDCLPGMDAVVTSMTISTLEVAFAGIPQVIMYLPGELGYTCLPEKIRDELCKVAYSSEEIAEKLGECLLEVVDNSSLAGFLIPKIRENVLRLFGPESDA
ncbi:MAG: packaged DNA stabilization protein gp10 [Lachnospiraceae bacterium]|nr:packaged DNA stabilization protein gp10 [Lachnospiraceae bacterium]